MSLRLRITLTLVGIAALLLAPAIYGLLNLRELEGIVRDVQSRNAASILALGRLATAVAEVDNAQRIYLALADQPAEVRDQSAAAVSAGSGEVEEALGQLATAGFDDVVDETRRKWLEIDRLLDQQRRLIEGAEVEAADELSDARLAPALSGMAESLDDLAQRIDQRGESQVVRATQIAAEAVRTTVVAMIVAVLAAIAIGAALGRALLRPIAELRRATRRVARGEFQLDLARTVARDDELGELGRAFARMAADLAELDRIKAEFVSIASHELKTPLSVIKGYVTLLREGRYGEPTERGLEVLATIERQVAHLDRMIRRLLDVSRFEAGGGRLEPAEVDLPALLSHLEESFTALAIQSHVDFRLDLGDGLPSKLVADPDRLNEVIGNLLSNAFKFTPEGGRIVLAARAADAGGGPGVAIEVADSGPGIPPEALPRVFDKFYQVEGQPSPRQPGSGLGLAIARHIVEAHGGTITAESTVGKGTTFRVLLPLRPVFAAR